MGGSSPRATPEFYRWTFAGAPIRIDLALPVVERLRRELIRSRDVEIGGILLGEPPSESQPAVRITDFRPFPMRDRSRWALSETQVREFAQTVSESRASGRPAPVGCYRSHLRSANIRLDPPDLELMRASLNKPSDVMLVMRADAGGEVTAGFFFWDEGRVQGDFSFLEFPFQADELRPQSERRPPGAGRRFEAVLFWSAIAMVVLVAVSLFGLRARKSEPSPATAQAPPAIAPAALGLRCEVSGAQSRIAWDKFAPAVATARVGLLSINDGNRQRSMSLTAEELRTGSVLFNPVSATVLLRLEVFDASGAVVREIAAAALPARDSPAIPAPRKPELAVSGIASRELRQPARLFNPPAQPVSPGAAAAVPDPPLLNPSPGPIGEIVHLAPAAVPERPPEPTVAPADSIQPPAAPAAAPGGVQRAQASQPDRYDPPAPVTQVRPVLPAAARAMLSREIKVQVRVHVDENGRVIDAESATTDQPLDRLLAAFAEQAARQWRFRPARRNSETVPADVVVNFIFGPGR